MVLLIAVTWRGVDEPIPEAQFFSFSNKKKKKDQICVFFEVIDIYFISLFFIIEKNP